MQRVAQRAAHAIEGHDHFVGLLEFQAITKAKNISAEKMNVCFAGMLVTFMLEVMVFQIGK